MKSKDSYFELDTDEKVTDYIRDLPLLGGKFGANEELLVSNLADGNVNYVYSIMSKSNPQNTVVIKQALPYLRIMKEWKLSRERLEFEAKYYSVCNDLGIVTIPKIFGYDDKMSVIILENLNKHIILRQGLTDGLIYPMVGKDIGHFLGVILYQTSDFHMDYKDKVKETIRFANPELCKLTHNAVFTGSYRPPSGLFRADPLLEEQARSIKEDQELKAGVMEMKYGFMNKAQALIHGDLHSGSFMVNESDSRVIDPEFCFFGPMGFDIGAIIGNFFLNYAVQSVRMKDNDQRKKFQAYLLEMVEDIWHVFSREFEEQWRIEADVLCTPVYRRNFLREILQDAAGYAGCKMIRRVMEGARVGDFATIKDERDKAEAESLDLEIGRNLIIQRNSFENIFDLISTCVESRPIFTA